MPYEVFDSTALTARSGTPETFLSNPRSVNVLDELPPAPFAVGDRFDIRPRHFVPLIAGGVTLADTTVHQQIAYEPVTDRIFSVQRYSGGPDGDLKVTRFDRSGNVDGSMILTGFDHGTNFAVEYDAGTVYMWVPCGFNGTSARGTRIARIYFLDGANWASPAQGNSTSYEPFLGTTQINVCFDFANGMAATAHNTGGATQYNVFELAQFRAKNFVPLYTINRTQTTNFQTWTLRDGFIYQFHGGAYDDTSNPTPPRGRGNVRMLAINITSGAIVEDRTDFYFAPGLYYREAEALAVFDLPQGPALVLGFAAGRQGERVAHFYSCSATVNGPNPGDGWPA